MRFTYASLALGVGLLALAPEPAEACHRRGARVATPVYYQSACCPPAGYHSGGYHQPSGYQPGGYQPGGYQPGGYHQPGSYYQPGSYPAPGGYYPPPSTYPPGTYPPGTYPPGTYPPGGYQPGTSPPITMPSPTGTTSVAALDNRFDPPTITVSQGATVRWTNKGENKHTVTSETGGFDSGDLAPGQGFSTTFTKAGTFEYNCKHHRSMKGTVIVK
jgi:hypothetical protein